MAIRIDEGKLKTDLQTYQNQDYYNLDQTFFQSIVVRIDEKTITDEEIR